MDLSWITAAATAQLPVGDPAAIAFSLESDRSITYGELLELQNRYANGLLDLGVEPGDRVGILQFNCVEYVALYFAIARIGAIAVRLNFRLTTSELEFALDDSGCSVVCLQSEFLERLEPVRESVGVREWLVFGQEAASLPAWARAAEEFERKSTVEPAVPRPAASAPVMLMYTSGTTGFPKAAVWTHETAIGCATGQTIKFSYGPHTVAMTTGPLYHAGAFETLLLPALLARGRAICTRSGGFDIERVIEVAEREGVTDIMLYPFMVYDLMRLPELDGARLPALRRIITGGDPIMPWALDAARGRFPDVEIMQGYGLTEGTQSTCLDGVDGARHPDSIGRPFPLKEVKVVREDDTLAATDEVGEILIRGPGTCRSYWRREEETARTFTPDGWLRTGDVGRVSDGLLFLAGRKKDMIRSGGENISPAEVEQVLTSHWAIADAAVVAVPHSRYLEVGCAVLVLAPGAELSDAEVVAYCRERIAAYKCPKHVVRVDGLPRNASGKVLKGELRKRYRPLGEQPEAG
jgi:fatty-acyl-CoA synthase